jgi:tetratricopeptide (TPR) repeat protein
MDHAEDVYEKIELADEKQQIGYARILCELYLKDNPNHGPALIRYAINLISLGQYSLAQKALDHAEEVVKKEHLQYVLAQRGHLLRERGEFEAAEAMYLRAHELDPINATYLIFAGLVAFQSGNISRAIQFTRQATQCAGGCVDEAYFNLGGYLLSDRQYPEAAKCYHKALEIDPQYAIAKERLRDVESILAFQERGLPAGSSDHGSAALSNRA